VPRERTLILAAPGPCRFVRDQDIDAKLFDPPVCTAAKADGVSLFRNQIPVESRINPVGDFHNRKNESGPALSIREIACRVDSASVSCPSGFTGYNCVALGSRIPGRRQISKWKRSPSEFRRAHLISDPGSTALESHFASITMLQFHAGPSARQTGWFGPPPKPSSTAPSTGRSRFRALLPATSPWVEVLAAV